jgi:hypothetical protein
MSIKNKWETNVQSLLGHIKISNKYVMVFGSSRASQRDQIFNMIYFMGTPSFFSFVHHPSIVVLIKQKNP